MAEDLGGSVSDSNEGERPGWMHPLFFYPVFLVGSAWIPFFSALALDSSINRWIRFLGACAVGSGVAFVIWMIKNHRRR